MMDFKVVRQVVVFALVFTMLAKHQVWGEIDCHDEKVSVMLKSGAKLEIFGVGSDAFGAGSTTHMNITK